VKAYRRIVVGVDFSAGSQAAIGAVEAVAGSERIEVYLVHVIEPPPYILTRPTDALVLARSQREEARVQLQRLAEAMKRRLGKAVTVRETLVPGIADTEICKLAERARAHLVIVGSHGRRGFRRALLGSVAERVARFAGRPVLVVPLAGAHRR
jgi:nucleotide-binding universal stress UspA family protein